MMNVWPSRFPKHHIEGWYNPLSTSAKTPLSASTKTSG